MGHAPDFIKVFLSYSHDSEEHAQRVRELSDRLRADGVDCRIDQYETAPREGWRHWMDRQLAWADYVLMVCTDTYHRRVRLDEKPGRGLGAAYEGSIMLDLLYAAGMCNDRTIPVLFEGARPEDVPLPLRQYTRYRLWKQYDDLYRHLTGQPRVVPRTLGQVRKMPPEPPAWPAGEKAGAAGAESRSEEPDGQCEAQDATPSETAEPSRVGGQYRLLRKLGEGGFGRVFAAQDELLNRPVAVKLVPLGGRLAQARDEVLAEAQTPVLGSFGATIRRPIMQSC